MAAKSKYCLEFEDFIAEHYALGLTVPDIADALELHSKTVYTWIDRKTALKKKIANLRLDEAKKRIGQTDSHWFLERTQPQFRIDKTINLNQTVNVKPEDLTDEELAQIVAGYRKEREDEKTPKTKTIKRGEKASKLTAKGRKKKSNGKTRGRPRKLIVGQSDDPIPGQKVNDEDNE